MTQLSIIEAGPAPSPELSQWFTPPQTAEALVSLAREDLVRWTRVGFAPRVLEPSVGRGNLVRAVLALCPAAMVDAIDIDERWRDDLVSIGAAVNFEAIDYLERPAPRERYDLAVTNPPFDDGAEGPHLAKLLDEAEQILCLVPTRTLHGEERYRLIWHRFDRRANPNADWSIVKKAHLKRRPKFSAAGGTDEIVLLHLVRGRNHACEVIWL